MKMKGFYLVLFSTEELKDEMLKEIIQSEIKMNILAAKRNGDSKAKDKKD